MKVILPGSYDPVTLGHLSLIESSAKRYDEVYVVAFINPDKKYLFSESDRVEMMKLATAHIQNVTVDFSSGLVVDYMKQKGISKIVKGYRNDEDLAYERIQADFNFQNGGFETELIRTSDSLSLVSSTEARRLIREGKSLSGMLPEKVIEFLVAKD